MNYTMLEPGWVAGKTSINVTSPFGKRKNRRHEGIDIGIPEGTKIYAPLSGTITCRFDKNGYGLYLTLDTGNIQLRFGHLNRTVISQGQNKRVKKGDQIAWSGGRKGDPNAGCSTGPHLHFEYRYNGTAIDPKYVISDQLTGSVKRNIIKNAVPLSTTDSIPSVEITQAMMDASWNYDIEGMTDGSATEDWNWEPTEYEMSDRLAGGIWQIIKLAMDSNVANLRLHDTSISVQTGSLVNFFQKVCQQPLVEFSGDTYGDQYYFLVRKPPFDRETMRKTLDVQDLLNDNPNADNPYWIKPIEIISANITYGSPNIYSWYQLFPIYEMGNQQDLQYIVPAVFFPEFAAIWGSKDLSVRSQYRTFVASEVYDKTENNEPTAYGDAEVRHSLDDLRYIIECNAYNAFTRSGSLTLVGHRKIKRGMFIRVELDGVDEIYYVESVSHSANITNGSINRTTTLQLSHGMVKRYMFDNISVKNYNKTPGDYEIYKSDISSYFNIIDFGDYMEKTKNERLSMDNWREVISSWKVNVDVFKFFLRKYQFLV